MLKKYSIELQGIIPDAVDYHSPRTAQTQVVMVSIKTPSLSQILVEHEIAKLNWHWLVGTGYVNPEKIKIIKRGSVEEIGNAV